MKFPSGKIITIDHDRIDEILIGGNQIMPPHFKNNKLDSETAEFIADRVVNITLDKVQERVRKLEGELKVEKLRSFTRNENPNLTCPSCHNHNLQVKEDTAKCNDGKCGKEFLLVEKMKGLNNGKKKNFLCTNCGYSISKDQVAEIKKMDSCPLCQKGKSFVDIDWNTIESQINNGRINKI